MDDQMKEKPWNRCDYCGRFLALRAFLKGSAVRKLVSHDTAFSSENYETYHVRCQNKEVCQSSNGPVSKTVATVKRAGVRHP